MLFIKLIEYVEKGFKKIKIYAPLREIIGGLLIIGVIYLFNSLQSLGIGDGTINRIVSGEKFRNSLFINKSLVTALTLGSSGSSEILTPMPFIGSLFGNIW